MTYVKLQVTLRNSKGDEVSIWSEGEDFEEAAQYAVEDHRADTNDPSWEVVKTGDYRT